METIVDSWDPRGEGHAPQRAEHQPAAYAQLQAPGPFSPIDLCELTVGVVGNSPDPPLGEGSTPD